MGNILKRVFCFHIDEDPSEINYEEFADELLTNEGQRKKVTEDKNSSQRLTMASKLKLTRPYIHRVDVVTPGSEPRDEYMVFNDGNKKDQQEMETAV